MQHLLYALQAVLPTLLLLLLGAFLRRINLLTDRFAIEGDKFCMQVLFPVLIFRNILQGQGQTDVYLKSIGFAYGVIIISIVAGLLIVPRLIHDRRRVAVLIQTMYRGNYTLYGIPFAQLLGGDSAAAVASAIAAATLPVLNISGVMMYAYYAGAEKQSFTDAIKRVLKNPIIWGIFLAILFRQFHMTLPQPIDRFSKNLADMASPLAFILLGTKLRRSSFSHDRALSVFVVIFKLLIMPAVFLPFAIFALELRGINLIPLFLFTAAPSAITTYQLAVQYEADDVLAGNLVMLTTLLSTISICVLVSILKSLSLI